MKKLLLSITAFLFISFTGFSCSSDNDNPSESEIPEGNSKVLITYFSFPETDGVDAVSGASRVRVNETLYGNTQYMAEVIKEATKGDLFRIETVQEYPGLHAPLVEQASKEKAEGVRAELKTKMQNLDEYDIIFIGYPNW